MTTPDEHRRNAIAAIERIMRESGFDAVLRKAGFANTALTGIATDAYTAAEPILRRAFAEEAAAAIYTLPYLAELPTPDLENEVKVVSRPDVVRLVREIGGIA